MSYIMPSKGYNVPTGIVNTRAAGYGAGGTSRSRYWQPNMGYANQQQMDPMQQMFQEYQNAYGRANAANEGRYRDILKGYNMMGRQSLALANQATAGATDEINRNFNAQQGSSMSGLVQRGLANTTILPSVQAGIERNRGYALNDASRQSAQMKMGVIGNIGQAKMGFMERRNDVAPDLSQAYALAQQAGQTGYGYQPRYATGGGGGGGDYIAGVSMNGMQLGNMPTYGYPTFAMGGSGSRYMPRQTSRGGYSQTGRDAYAAPQNLGANQDRVDQWRRKYWDIFA